MLNSIKATSTNLIKNQGNSKLLSTADPAKESILNIPSCGAIGIAADQALINKPTAPASAAPVLFHKYLTGNATDLITQQYILGKINYDSYIGLSHLKEQAQAKLSKEQIDNIIAESIDLAPKLRSTIFALLKTEGIKQENLKLVQQIYEKNKYIDRQQRCEFDAEQFLNLMQNNKGAISAD